MLPEASSQASRAQNGTGRARTGTPNAAASGAENVNRSTDEAAPDERHARRSQRRPIAGPTSPPRACGRDPSRVAVLPGLPAADRPIPLGYRRPAGRCALCAVLLWGAATAILVVVGAGLVHGFAPWLERAARHAEFARAIFALGSELDRQGPGIPLARLCLLQARFDVLVVKLPPPPSRAPTIRARPETGLLR